jgi:hypothetical protein
MPESSSREYWTVWYPQAAATGLLLARCLVDRAETILLHAAPDKITVEVTSEDGRRLAYGKDLPATLESPMCQLLRQGEHIARTDLWPGPDDLGTLVLLPGGEAGFLKAWWHAPNLREWRWQVEFYNRLD